MMKRPTLAAVLLILAALRASAQISLSSAVDLALRNDPRVKMAEADVKKAQAGLDATYDAYVPKVGLDAGYGKGIGVPTGLPTVVTLSSQSLIFNFSQKDNIRSAAAAVEAAKLALREMKDAVAEDVVTTYVNLASDQKRQQAMKDEYGYATRLQTIVQARTDAGQDSQTALLQARKIAKQIELDQLHLDDEAVILAHHLSVVIGLPDRGFQAVQSSIPSLPPVAEISKDALADTDSYGVQSALLNAKSKRQYAFGMGRYVLRPQISLIANYSRIDTGQNDYTEYYPSFVGKSKNAESIYFAMQLPIFDRRHQDEAKQATADAIHAEREAEQQRNQFLDGRFRLRHNATELSLRCDLAEIDRDLATQQLNAVITQQSADASGVDKMQMTPKDEQNARIEERQRTLDLLKAQFELDQTRVNLLRQTGQLDVWLKTSLGLPSGDSTTLLKP
jgi:outer membrane protein TolC